ncbi:hypothetical protein ECTW09195_2430, partial [Escherichia coli TW09195]
MDRHRRLEPRETSF